MTLRCMYSDGSVLAFWLGSISIASMCCGLLQELHNKSSRWRLSYRPFTLPLIDVELVEWLCADGLVRLNVNCRRQWTRFCLHCDTRPPTTPRHPLHSLYRDNDHTSLHPHHRHVQPEAVGTLQRFDKSTATSCLLARLFYSPFSPVHIRAPRWILHQFSNS